MVDHMSRPERVSLASRARAATALLAVLCVLGSAFPASADDPRARLDGARAALDEAADGFFALQTEVRNLDTRIDALEQQLADAQRRSAAARDEATARALQIYKSAGTPFEHVIADDAIDAARRVELIDRANASSAAAFDELAAVIDEIEHRKAELEAEREARADTLSELAERRRELEERVEAARVAYLDAARAPATTTTSAAAAPRPQAAPGPTPTTGAPSEAIDLARTVDAAPVAGAHPQHDHPFLVCTRQRESGGDYTVVSAAGYYGAYQFARSTWDATAVHAGRPELIGVAPNRSSEHDQDDMAWSLFRWQGKEPWGDRC
jgi:peptidoglycan hydrolase CwlO-like protein